MTRRCEEEVSGSSLRTGSTHGAVGGPSDGRGGGLGQRWGRSWREGWGLGGCRGGGLGGWSAKTGRRGVDNPVDLICVTCRLRTGERRELAAHLPLEHAVFFRVLMTAINNHRDILVIYSRLPISFVFAVLLMEGLDFNY